MPITPDNYAFPFDPTGTAASNKVTGEVHVITQQNHRDYSFVIPVAAPFFGEGMRITFTDVNGVLANLIEGTDYYFGHHFLAASRSVGKQIYGSISFINKAFKGTMSLSYQTLGGKWTYSQNYLNEIMTNIISNPRSSSWDSIVELPGLFPVIDHEWNLTDMVGMAEVVAGLFGIEEAIRDPSGEGTGGGSASQLMSHLLNKTNPHAVTKLQVGLGKVEDFEIATVDEAKVGSAINKYMTPSLVKAAILEQVLTSFNTHAADKNNPHETTKAQVGLGSVENYAVASTVEAQAGVATNRYMTPKATKEAIDSLANGAVSTHVSDLDNPHEVTKSQVGLGSVQDYPVASTVEAQTGTAANRYMTAKSTKEAIDSQVKDSYVLHAASKTNPHEVTAAQVGAYSKLQMDELLLDKVDIDGTAADSTLFNGKTVQEISALILAGKVSDADKLDDRDSAQLKAWILEGTAANSTLFDGKTYNEVILAAQSSVDLDLDFAPQSKHQDQLNIGVGTHSWTLFATINLPDPLTPNVAIQDGQYFIAGTDSRFGNKSTLYYLRFGLRGPVENIIDAQLYNFAGNNVGSSVGYVINDVDKQAELWIRTPNGRNSLSVTSLNSNVGQLVDGNGLVISDEPIGIVYVTETKKVADSILFDGRTTAEVTALILAGIAADASKLGGQLPAYYAAALDLSSHIENVSNPHSVDKTDVGLSAVQNYGLATKLEAETGTAANKYMTPLRVSEAITALVGTPLTNRIDATDLNLSTMVTDLTTLFNGFTV